jgi:ABC-type Mn2+/Zn2+ transport system ATPase subunit
MGAYGRLRGWRGLARRERELARATLARVGMETRARRVRRALGRPAAARAHRARADGATGAVDLDEPTSGVDRGAQKRILDLLIELNREEHIAILLVSHQIGDGARRRARRAVGVRADRARRSAARAARERAPRRAVRGAGAGDALE